MGERRQTRWVITTRGGWKEWPPYTSFPKNMEGDGALYNVVLPHPPTPVLHIHRGLLPAPIRTLQRQQGRGQRSGQREAEGRTLAVKAHVIIKGNLCLKTCQIRGLSECWCHSPVSVRWEDPPLRHGHQWWTPPASWLAPRKRSGRDRWHGLYWHHVRATPWS